jgi:hypothetical protein
MGSAEMIGKIAAVTVTEINAYSLLGIPVHGRARTGEPVLEHVSGPIFEPFLAEG